MLTALFKGLFGMYALAFCAIALLIITFKALILLF